MTENRVEATIRFLQACFLAACGGLDLNTPLLIQIWLFRERRGYEISYFALAKSRTPVNLCRDKQGRKASEGLCMGDLRTWPQ